MTALQSRFVCDAPVQPSPGAKSHRRGVSESGPGRGRVQNGGASFPEGATQEIRASDRWLLYSLIRKLLRPADGSRGPATAACGLPRDADEAVALLKRGEGSIGVTGVYRCKSPWLCPVCAPAAAKVRQQKLQKIVDAAASCAMVTLTIRHKAQDTLATLKGLVSSASRRARQGRSWQEIKEAGALLGVIQGVEVLWSRRAGWHFHLHLLLVSQSWDESAILEAGHQLIERYRTKIAEQGGDAQRVGQDIRIVTSADYPAKGSAAWEVAGGLKSGFGGLINPWDLAQLAHAGDAAGLAAWQEYTGEMPGTQSCRISPQLAKALDIDLSKDEGGEEQDETGELIGTISAPIWSRLRRFGQCHRPIRLAEDGAAWAEIDQLVRELDADIRAAFDDPIADAPEYAADYRRSAARPITAFSSRPPVVADEPPPAEADYARVGRIASGWGSGSTARGLRYAIEAERHEIESRGRDFRLDIGQLQAAVVAAAATKSGKPAMGGLTTAPLAKGSKTPVEPQPPSGGAAGAAS